MNKKSGLYFTLGLWLLMFSCKEKTLIPSPKRLFTKIEASHSQLFFNNQIRETDTLNYHNFPYIYMGGGLAIGDFNKDGLSDVFLTGNMVENKLYLNKGNLVFEDITVSAGVQGDQRWYTGVSLVDINEDGYLDIYLSVSGKNGDSRNQLYINNGDLTFTEQAAVFGVADASPSIQSTFFDYDLDGDLDLFVANYPLVPLSRGNAFYAALMKENKLENSGHLYRNDGLHFTEVTQQAGLQNFGLTLGLSSADFNNDALPDLYLSNDFNVPDYLYLNQGDGTFQEVLKNCTGHTSMFGMGIDVADFNNDALPDLIQADMTPNDYKRAKINMASMSPRTFWEAVNMGFHFQYMQNSLQLNRGIDGNGLPQFSEMSQFAGVSNTDWSWSTLFADFDNDGWKDIFISNGMKRDVNDNDFNRRTAATSFNAAFKKIDIKTYPSEPISNFAFKNKGNLSFTSIAKDWGLETLNFSNGAAYADLDNDGDLDLLINNIDEAVTLFENKTNAKEQYFLRIQLNGPPKNPFGIGTKILLKDKITNKTQYQELLLTRGFQSSVEPIIHFGLGKKAATQELTIIWPDRKEEQIQIDQLNQFIHLNYDKASFPKKLNEESTTVFKNISAEAHIGFKHQEDIFDDYKTAPLLPHKYSTLGPGLAVADVNQDGLDDFFVGGAKGQAAALFFQNEMGVFKKAEENIFETNKNQENTGALFFDADADGDQDLYIACGGNDAQASPNYYQDRFYVNIDGQLIEHSAALPQMRIAGQEVLNVDFDENGRADLLIAGRNTPGQYPKPPASFLLKNNGKRDLKLQFEDVTVQIAPFLADFGMLTAALWIDLDGDERNELILAGEWLPISVFKMEQNQFVDISEKLQFDPHQGWWYSLASLDIDLDGDLDLIAGNLGLNYKYKASATKPFELFSDDFDKNGSMDIVFSVYKEGKQRPLRGRECSSEQIPAIQTKFKTYRAFADADLGDIYGEKNLENALQFQANTFAHYWIENKKEAGFVWHELPPLAQLTPMHRIIPFDYNGDEYLDLLTTGALYDAEVETPRADAGMGLVLINKKGKGFKAIPNQIHQLFKKGNYTKIEAIKLGKDFPAYLFAGSDEEVDLVVKDNK
jgi:hypothetical protein